MLDDYIAQAPPGSNEAVTKPRYHGASGNHYCSAGTKPGFYTCAAGGHKVADVFSAKLETTDEDYVAHTLDMGKQEQRYACFEWR